MHYFTKYICATYFYITFYRDNFYNSNSWRTCYYGLWTGILTRSNSLKFILLMCENCLTSPFMAINISVHKIKSFIILCRSYQEGCGIPVVEDPTGSWGWGSSSCSWPSYCKSARFWLDIWWNSSQSNKEKKKGKKKRYQQTQEYWCIQCCVTLVPSEGQLTAVQLLRAEMHFLLSHHWHPLVLAVQLVQSEKR